MAKTTREWNFQGCGSVGYSYGEIDSDIVEGDFDSDLCGYSVDTFLYELKEQHNMPQKLYDLAHKDLEVTDEPPETEDDEDYDEYRYTKYVCVYVTHDTVTGHWDVRAHVSLSS